MHTPTSIPSQTHTHQKPLHLRRCDKTQVTLMSLDLAGQCIGQRNFPKQYTFDIFVPPAFHFSVQTNIVFLSFLCTVTC
uniref:Uncharacterized protein n=1 Tax=Octopus bimaculoides TaxID=37653 RepID=A0A0L8GUB2_OCTBM